MRILLVDDEREVLDLFRDLLKAKGYQVDCALGGKAALEFISKHKPDAVLLDIKMPEMDGGEVLQAIKKKDPSIDVVMLTGYGYDDKLMNDLMKKGASGYISKNLPIQQIINTFNTLLGPISMKNNSK